MSLIYCDSFDQVKLFQMRTLPSEATTPLSIQNLGINGGNALRMGQSSTGSAGGFQVDLLANKTTVIMGGYFQLTADQASDTSSRNRFEIMATYDENDELPQIRLAFDPANRNFQIFRGTTLLATTAATGNLIDNIWRSFSWHYIELKVTHDDAAGLYEVRLNGKNILSDSGIDTKNSTHAYATHAVFGNCYTSSEDNFWMLDSCYVCDDAGAVNNDFLGAIRVQYLAPGAQGLYDYWQEYEVGSQLVAINESGDDDDDTSYIISPHANSPLGNKAVGDISTFKNTTGIAEAAATIHAIAVNIVVRGTRERNETTRQVAAYYGHNKTYEQGAAVPLNGRAPYANSALSLFDRIRYGDVITSYYGYQWITETNVRTAAVWSVGDVTGIDFGVKLTA